MKKNFTSITYSLFSIFLLLLFSSYSQTAKACVDPDTIATLTINYTADFSEAEIRIGNLKLETSAPNTFCACGLSSEASVFTFVTYIAVVYEGTNDVYDNFVPFIQSGPSDDAWDASQPALPGWNGYVAEVINGGLVADEAVELIIRAQAPPNVMVELASDPQTDTSTLYYQTYLGTDEWDPDAMDLKEDHQAIRTFGFMSNISSNVLPQSYFDDLDATITGVYDIGDPAVQSGKVFPNPAAEYIDLSFGLAESAELELIIYDISGRIMHRVLSQPYQGGEHNIHLSFAGILPESGIYIASLRSAAGQSNFKFVKQ